MAMEATSMAATMTGYTPPVRVADPVASTSSHTLSSPIFAPLLDEAVGRRRRDGMAPSLRLGDRLVSSWRGDAAGHALLPAMALPFQASSRPSAASFSAVPNTETNHTKQSLAPLCETDEMSRQSGGAEGTHDGVPGKGDAAPRPPIDKRSPDYILRSGLAGGVAGCVAKTAIAPLDRVKILFQAQNPEYQKYSGKWTGVFVAGREIMRNDGVMALFQGHSATLLRIFPYAAIKYMAYDSLHFLLMPTKEYETSARLFFAGAASGVTSVFVTYPLELIRVRLAFETKRKRQKGSLIRIIRKIYAEGTTEAPFSGDARKRAAGRATAAGASPPSYGVPASASAAQLSTSAIQNAAIANGATAASPVPTSPIPTSTAIATHRALQGFPFLKFYRGFAVTVMGMIPYAGTSFLVFGRCKTLMQQAFGTSNKDGSGEDGTWNAWRPSKTTVDLSAGALAGAISQTAAYPFEVVRRRQQIGGIIRPSNILGVRETALWIWRTSGWRGFYVGLSIGFLKVVPMTSISFAVWMGMKRQMGI